MRKLLPKTLFMVLILIHNASLLNAQGSLPADKKATKETIHLYQHLRQLRQKGIMFGHQDDLAYGVGWKYQDGRSDIKDVTGDYPAVYGWELGHLELDSAVNIDSVPFDKMRHYIREGYDRGGVITISWHLHNPLTGKTAWDPAPGSVASALPGGTSHELYVKWLDKVADFFLSLKGENGEFIPVIFRPFHELNGSWFWWGGKNSTPAELIQLYRFTEAYLRDTRNIHHLLYAYNTDRFQTREEYLERYPGDEWVDLVGFDIYQRTYENEKFIAELDQALTTLETIAEEKDKIPALTEFGYNGIPDPQWWTNVLWKSIQSHQISYVLGWRNAGFRNKGFEYYVPYKGQASADNFIQFYKEPRSLFQKDVARKKLYR